MRKRLQKTKQRGGKLVFPYTGGRPESRDAVITDTLDWDDQQEKTEA